MKNKIKKIVLRLVFFFFVKQMDQALLDLLRKYHTPNTSQFTYFTTYGPNAKWCIPDANCESFWRSYCSLVNEGEEKNLCLAELPRDRMPIIANFTLKFHPLDGNTETYDNDFLLENLWV